MSDYLGLNLNESLLSDSNELTGITLYNFNVDILILN
jgi:hypothetical protein